MKLKPETLPWVVVVYAAILALGGLALGIGAFANPASAVNYIDGADGLALGWAGRTLGLGLAMVLALYLRSAAVYAVGFAGAVGRELGDLVAALNIDAPLPMIAVICVLLALDAICLWLCLRGAVSTTTPEPKEETS